MCEMWNSKIALKNCLKDNFVITIKYDRESVNRGVTKRDKTKKN